jgi:hypothetical protein
MKKVSGPQVVTSVEALESPLPAEIQEALGELVGAAREGLLALSVGLGHPWHGHRPSVLARFPRQPWYRRHGASVRTIASSPIQKCARRPCC